MGSSIGIVNTSLVRAFRRRRPDTEYTHTIKTSLEVKHCKRWTLVKVITLYYHPDTAILSRASQDKRVFQQGQISRTETWERVYKQHIMFVFLFSIKSLVTDLSVDECVVISQFFGPFQGSIIFSLRSLH